MKKLLITIIIFLAFFLGYFFASKEMLATEFMEVNSNALSRSFLERSSLYRLFRQGQDDKLEKTLEALIFGDLVAMGEIGFSSTSNSELLCAQLKELQLVLEGEAFFSSELDRMAEICK